MRCHGCPALTAEPVTLHTNLLVAPRTFDEFGEKQMLLRQLRQLCDRSAKIVGESESSCDRCAIILRQERQVNLFGMDAEPTRWCTMHEGPGVYVATVARL